MTGGQMFAVCLLCFFVGFLCCGVIFIKLEDNKEKMIKRLQEALKE